MKGAAELAEVRRREGNARWLHLRKGGAKSLNFRREEPRGAEARTKKVQCLCDIGRGHCDEALENGVLVVAVDCAMSDAAIFQILNEVRGEEALSDAAFRETARSSPCLQRRRQ
jgi:hypothetical protein